MEKLQRRSDGIAETRSGLFAVAPLRSSGKDNHFKWFDFRKTAVSDVIRVRWPIDEEIAVIEAGIANFMLNKKYARQVSDRQINEWNEAIDQLELDAPNPQPVVIEESEVDLFSGHDDGSGDDGMPKQEQPQEPVGAQTPPQATQAPAGGQTPPEALENAANGTAAPQGMATGNQPPSEGPETGETGPKEGEEGADGADGAPEDNGDSTDSEDKDEEETDNGSEGSKPKGKKKATKGLL
jgi:hypothetical protein